MAKLMTLVKARPHLSRDIFALRWRDDFLPRFEELADRHGGLLKAVHNHVLPSEIRASEGLGIAQWSGIGCYYFNHQRDIEALIASPELSALLHEADGPFAEVTHSIVDEVWIYNRDTSLLPIKAFAFFKRRPEFSRKDALHYYQTTHAAVGESINRNRTVRYVQNHVVDGYVNPDARYDYDGGPEIWFKSREIAMDLYNDRAGMEILGRDEAKFVIRDDLLHFMTDEVVVLDRQPAMA